MGGESSGAAARATCEREFALRLCVRRAGHRFVKTSRDGARTFARCSISPNSAWVAALASHERQAGDMPDLLSLLTSVGLAVIVCVAGWFPLLRRHRHQIDKLLALHERQIGVSVQRLAEARRRSDALKQEVLLLKKELVQQQTRWLRATGRGLTAVEAVDAPRHPEMPAVEPRSEEESGFAHTQPWQDQTP